MFESGVALSLEHPGIEPLLAFPLSSDQGLRWIIPNTQLLANEPQATEEGMCLLICTQEIWGTATEFPGVAM